MLWYKSLCTPRYLDVLIISRDSHQDSARWHVLDGEGMTWSSDSQKCHKARRHRSVFYLGLSDSGADTQKEDTRSRPCLHLWTHRSSALHRNTIAN